MNFGTKLRKIRKMRGLSLKTVADAFRIGASTLSEYENNMYEPSLSKTEYLNFSGKYEDSKFSCDYIFVFNRPHYTFLGFLCYDYPKQSYRKKKIEIFLL